MKRLAVLVALTLGLLALPAQAVGVGPTQYGCLMVGTEAHTGVYFGDYAHDAFGVAWSVNSQNKHQVGSVCYGTSVNLNASLIAATVRVDRWFYPSGWAYCTQVTQTRNSQPSASVNPSALYGQGPCGQANWPAGYTRVTLDGYYRAYLNSPIKSYHRVFTG